MCLIPRRSTTAAHQGIMVNVKDKFYILQDCDYWDFNFTFRTFLTERNCDLMAKVSLRKSRLW